MPERGESEPQRQRGERKEGMVRKLGFGSLRTLSLRERETVGLAAAAAAESDENRRRSVMDSISN